MRRFGFSLRQRRQRLKIPPGLDSRCRYCAISETPRAFVLAFVPFSVPSPRFIKNLRECFQSAPGRIDSLERWDRKGWRGTRQVSRTKKELKIRTLRDTGERGGGRRRPSSPRYASTYRERGHFNLRPSSISRHREFRFHMTRPFLSPSIGFILSYLKNEERRETDGVIERYPPNRREIKEIAIFSPAFNPMCCRKWRFADSPRRWNRGFLVDSLRATWNAIEMGFESVLLSEGALKRENASFPSEIWWINRR